MLYSNRDKEMYSRLFTYRNIAIIDGSIAIENGNVSDYLVAQETYRRINNLIQDFFGDLDQFVVQDNIGIIDTLFPTWPEVITGDKETDEVFATDRTSQASRITTDHDADARPFDTARDTTRDYFFSDGSSIDDVDVPF